jgi:hypothetical protein
MNELNPQGHVYIANAMQWCVTGGNLSLPEAVKLFEKDKCTYCVYYVPLPPSADYEIKFYAPAVEGAMLLEMVEFKNGRKVKRVTTKE